LHLLVLIREDVRLAHAAELLIRDDALLERIRFHFVGLGLLRRKHCEWRRQKGGNESCGYYRLNYFHVFPLLNCRFCFCSDSLTDPWADRDSDLFARGREARIRICAVDRSGWSRLDRLLPYNFWLRRK